ncbi:iron complex outermembrane recepter protein [Colwellia chukchiensis]|uniref:Iron complex outermembrane recepter protein n=1 Tax=Colwellia chukchiensis TaxID=641665 RepID=A0A1H7PBL1_9GAMM|nr:TonB-dependent receptor [Colwellia chukchiensis]SEL32808.1 iron complex outermembrane recepter protein [Colwellia chukchiensis]
MQCSKISRTLAIIFSVTTTQAFADDLATNSIEVITIAAPNIAQSDSAFAEGNLIMPDVADWLKTVPGANINKNGPITGIAQYRGMFADRVAKNIAGQHIVSAGPNAMDAPLTYINPIMVQSVEVYRGIAPVSAGIDTLGGAIKVNLKNAEVDTGARLAGDLALSFNELNDASTFAGDININNKHNAALLYLTEQNGNNYQDGAGRTIAATQYNKQQYGGDLRHQQSNWQIGFSWHHAKTEDAGTPALPMDIDFIDSDRYRLDGAFQLSGWQLRWQLGYQDAVHGMDNFSQRNNNHSGQYRYNTTDAKSRDYKFLLSQADWLFGLESYNATHNAVITNPENMMFTINNFNQVKNQRNSVFVEWTPSHGQFSHTLGLRIKDNRADAAQVAHSMAMMNPNIKALRDEFNGAKRNVSDTTFDLALNSEYQWHNNLALNYALAIKQRAPSYQERYLWLPMQATGGLADGKTYVGNIHLRHESAYQVNVGLAYEQAGFTVAPQVFYQQIHDYIQGTPATDMRVKMVASMMADNSPLTFTNIDATLYGMDMNWHYRLDNGFSLSGIVSYVKGKRDDTNDDLYRISPLNSRINLHYHQQNWQSNLAIHAYAAQRHVSTLNNEQATAGYAVIDWQVDYFVSSGLVLRLGANNLLDRHYSDHLGGVNRVKGSELAIGEKITAMGRNIYLAIDYQF